MAGVKGLKERTGRCGYVGIDAVSYVCCSAPILYAGTLIVETEHHICMAPRKIAKYVWGYIERVDYTNEFCKNIVEVARNI
jgi:hypothetical protein